MVLDLRISSSVRKNRYISVVSKTRAIVTANPRKHCSSFENYIHWQIVNVLNELRPYGESLGLQEVDLQIFIKETHFLSKI